MSTDFYSLKICLLVTSKKNHMCQFLEIVRTRVDHPACQLTIAAQLLLDPGKIEPYTIIIMVRRFKKPQTFPFFPIPPPPFFWTFY
jgi:hypothetical protein